MDSTSRLNPISNKLLVYVGWVGGSLIYIYMNTRNIGTGKMQQREREKRETHPGVCHSTPSVPVARTEKKGGWSRTDRFRPRPRFGPATTMRQTMFDLAAPYFANDPTVVPESTLISSVPVVRSYANHWVWTIHQTYTDVRFFDCCSLWSI